MNDIRIDGVWYHRDVDDKLILEIDGPNEGKPIPSDECICAAWSARECCCGAWDHVTTLDEYETEDYDVAEVEENHLKSSSKYGW
jgi:hypothetical protein